MLLGKEQSVLYCLTFSGGGGGDSNCNASCLRSVFFDERGCDDAIA